MSRPGERKRPRALDVAAVALLLGALTAPAIGALLRPGAAAESVKVEQRNPTPLPDFPSGLHAAAKTPRALKAWHDDHLGLRDVLLEARSRLLLHGLGVSPTPAAVIGDDGWLWYASEDSFDAWRGARPLAPQQIEAWTRVFRDRAAWCRAHGIAFAAGLAPNKMQIYPERVPPPYRKLGPSRYEQISASLAAEPGGWYVDLGKELEDERTHDVQSPPGAVLDGDFVYSQRGTHWTFRAALRAETAMLARAHAHGGPDVRPRRADFEFGPIQFDDDNWTGQLHMPELPFETQPLVLRNLGSIFRPLAQMDGVPKRVETRNRNDELPRAWVVHDSFGSHLRPVFAPYFSRVIFDWRRMGELDTAAILAFDPRVVLEVHTERQISLPPPWLIASADEGEIAARFERSDEVVWRLADSAAAPRLGNRTRLRREDGELVVSTSGWGAYLEFPDASLSVRGTPILRLELHAERDGVLYVQWRSHGETHWRRSGVEIRKLHAGAQVVWVEFLDPKASGPIRISPDNGVGELRVRSGEVRSAGW